MVENNININPKFVHEVIYVMCESNKKFLILTFILLFGTALCVLPISHIGALVFICIAVLSIPSFVVYYMIMVNTREKQMNAIIKSTYHSDNYNINMKFTDEKIYLTTPNAQKEYWMSDIINVKETTNVIIIFLLGNVSVHVDKHGFVYGTEAELRTMINKAMSKS